MKCAEPACVEEHTLYNVRYVGQQNGTAKDPEWRCVWHLSKEMTFIVGLHSPEDLKKAGREKR